MYPSFSDKSFLPGAIYLRLSKDDEGAKEKMCIRDRTMSGAAKTSA